MSQINPTTSITGATQYMQDTTNTQHLEQAKSLRASDKKSPSKRPTSDKSRAMELWSSASHAMARVATTRNIYGNLILIHKQRSGGYGVNTERWNSMCMKYKNKNKTEGALRKNYDQAMKDGLAFVRGYWVGGISKTPYKVLMDQWELAYACCTEGEGPFAYMTQKQRMEFAAALKAFFHGEDLNLLEEAAIEIEAKSYPMVPQKTFIAEAISEPKPSISSAPCWNSVPVSSPLNSGLSIYNKIDSNISSLSPTPFSTKTFLKDGAEEERREKNPKREKRKFSKKDATPEGIRWNLEQLGASDKAIEMLMQEWENWDPASRKGKKLPAKWLMTMYRNGEFKLEEDVLEMQDRKTEWKAKNQRAAKRLQEGFERLYDVNPEAYTRHFEAKRKIIASDMNLRLESGKQFMYFNYEMKPETFIEETEKALKQMRFRK